MGDAAACSISGFAHLFDKPSVLLGPATSAPSPNISATTPCAHSRCPSACASLSGQKHPPLTGCVFKLAARNPAWSLGILFNAFTTRFIRKGPNVKMVGRSRGLFVSSGYALSTGRVFCVVPFCKLKKYGLLVERLILSTQPSGKRAGSWLETLSVVPDSIFSCTICCSVALPPRALGPAVC